MVTGGTQNKCNDCLKNRTVWIYKTVVHPNDGHVMAHSIEPDETAFFFGGGGGGGGCGAV